MEKPCIDCLSVFDSRGRTFRCPACRTKTCDICDATYRPIRPTQRFCSHACRDLGITGANSKTWKGGRHLNDQGYAWISVGSGKYALEHRVVMAEALGRPLEPHETVHHINGDKADNRIENLQLRQGRHGKGIVMTCKDCGSHNIESGRLADLVTSGG